MSSVAYALFASLGRKARALILSRSALLMVCYGAALITEQITGRGATGHHLLAFGAPLAVGLIIRFGARMRAADVGQLIAVHLAVRGAFSDPLAASLASAVLDVALIAASVWMFAALRARGFLKSPIRLMAATAIVAFAAPLATSPLSAAVMAAAGSFSVTALANDWLVDLLSLALGLAVCFAYGRDCWPAALDRAAAGESPPRVWEYPLAASLVTGLAICSLDGGRPEAGLAAAVMLLWFPLRLGLFATTVAALAFAGAMVHVGAAGRWAVALATPDPVEAQMLRYVTLALLTAPAIVVATVVHEQMRLKHMFAYRAMHDGLTTLVNRSRFLEVLEQAASAARTKNHRFLLLLIDLDHFKTVNDSFGHARGDQLLVEVSSRLRLSVRASDIVARFGGDEFAVVAPVPTIDDAMRLAKRLVEAVNQDCNLDGIVVRPSITVGGVLSPDSATDAQHLMLLADEAMYKAKAAGRNCWRFASTEKAAPPAPAWRLGDLDPPAETVLLD